MRIRALAAAGATAGLPLLCAGAAAQPVPPPAGAVVFAFGGTPVSNGVFFPGTTFYDSESREFETLGPPLQVQQGENLEFVNLDPAPHANSHRIRSVDVKRNGRPLFQSEDVVGPGADTVRTKALKPGTYYYLCTTHAGMFGVVEVVPAPQSST